MAARRPKRGSTEEKEGYEESSEGVLLPKEDKKVDYLPEDSSAFEPDFDMAFIIGAILLALLAFYIGYRMMQPDQIIVVKPRPSTADYISSLESDVPSQEDAAYTPATSSAAQLPSTGRKPSAQQQTAPSTGVSGPVQEQAYSSVPSAQQAQQSVQRRLSSQSEETVQAKPCSSLGLSKDFLGEYNYYAFIRTPLKSYRNVAMNIGGDRCVFYLTDGVIQDVADVGKEVADVDFYIAPEKFSFCKSAFRSKDAMALMSCMSSISTIPSSAKQAMCESAISQFSPMERMAYGRFCE